MLTEKDVRNFFRHCDRNINANIVPVDMTVSNENVKKQYC